MQIVEHPSFKALNKADKKYGHYLVNADTRLWVKYRTNSEGPWQFTVGSAEIGALSVDFKLKGSTYLVLICGDYSICCLAEEQIMALIDTTTDLQQWIRVEAPANKNMRVTGSRNNDEPILIAHNSFPGCVF
jgi:hypothetical protein